MRYSNDPSFAKDMDLADDLGKFRDAFHIPEFEQEPVTYLCGNSLGLMPKKTTEFVQQELKDWAHLGVEGHFKGKRPWLHYHENLTEPTASLVGAQQNEVVCMNTLTANLHLMMVSFYRPTKQRFKILIEQHAFPSDRYAVESQIRFHGLDPIESLLEIGPRAGESNIRPEDLYQYIEDNGSTIALILMPGVQYYTGQLFDMEEITRRGQAQGCVVGFDLAHAVGNVPLSLHQWEADFAVWCSYKYLNAGPGAVAGCFIHDKHVRNPHLQRFAGWWGHNKTTRFEMGPNYDPISTAEGWQLSNPPVLSAAPLIVSMNLFKQAGFEALRTKSEILTGYLEFLLQENLPSSMQIITPANPRQRGCQLSVRITQGNGKKIFKGLEDQHVICDWREPDVIRLAPAPLYNSYSDVHRCVAVLKKLM